MQAETIDLCASVCFVAYILANLHAYAYVCAHAGVHTNTHLKQQQQTKTKFVLVKVSVQCRSSFYEWLIKGETVVFSGNGGVVVTFFCSHRAVLGMLTQYTTGPPTSLRDVGGHGSNLQLVCKT